MIRILNIRAIFTASFFIPLKITDKKRKRTDTYKGLYRNCIGKRTDTYKGLYGNCIGMYGNCIGKERILIKDYMGNI